MRLNLKTDSRMESDFDGNGGGGDLGLRQIEERQQKQERSMRSGNMGVSKREEHYWVENWVLTLLDSTDKPFPSPSFPPLSLNLGVKTVLPKQ